MELEECLIMAIKQFGIDNFFACVPHNIEGGDPKRPYLISLIIKAMDYSSSTTSSSAASQGPFSMHSLTYFTSSLLPLSSRLFARAATLWQSSSNRSREAKLLETLAAQIWDILPGLCASCPGDVVMTGSGGGFAQLAPLLGRILQSSHGKCPLPEEYTSKGLEPAASSPDLRPLICLALHNLVDGQLALNKTQSHEQQQQVTDGLACLKSFSTRFLATLCNNFTSPDPQVIAGIVEQVQKKPSSSAAGLAAAAKNQVLQTFHEKETQKCEMAIKSYVQIAEAKV